MIKINEKKKWINQTLAMGFVVIFRSLLTEEPQQTKFFFLLFNILTNEEK